MLAVLAIVTAVLVLTGCSSGSESGPVDLGPQPAPQARAEISQPCQSRTATVPYINPYYHEMEVTATVGIFNCVPGTVVEMTGCIQLLQGDSWVDVKCVHLGPAVATVGYRGRGLKGVAATVRAPSYYGGSQRTMRTHVVGGEIPLLGVSEWDSRFSRQGVGFLGQGG